MISKKEFIEFYEGYKGKCGSIYVEVLLPSGATEIIVNNEKLDEKIKYYEENYTEDLRLIKNANIRITQWALSGQPIEVYKTWSTSRREE